MKSLSRSCMPFVALSLLVLLSACNSNTEGDQRTGEDRQDSPQIVRTDLPQHVLVLDPDARAFEIRGPLEMLFCAQLISWKDLEAKRRPMIFELHRVTDTGTRLIAHQLTPEGLVADLRAGESYLVMERPDRALRNLYRAVDRIHELQPELDRILPGLSGRICHFILCAPDIFRMDRIFEDMMRNRGPRGEDPLSPGDAKQAQAMLNLPDGPIGGWFPPGTDLCEVCTNFVPTPDDGDEEGDDEEEEGGTPIDASDLAPCYGATKVVFDADFEADTVGSPPSASPAGPPPGDTIEVQGHQDPYVVVNSAAMGSKCVKAERGGGGTDKIMDCIIDGPAVTAGTVCISFRAAAGVDAEASVLIEPRTADDRALLRLNYFGNRYTVVDAGGGSMLPGTFATDQVHELLLVLNMDLKVFDIYIDGQRVVNNGVFLNTWCVDLKKLQFGMLASYTEALPVIYFVDDVGIASES